MIVCVCKYLWYLEKTECDCFSNLLLNFLQDEEQRDQQSKVNFLSHQIITSFYDKLMSWFFFCVTCRLGVVFHLYLIHDVDILYLYDWCRFHFLYLTFLWWIYLCTWHDVICLMYLCTFDGYTCVHDVIYLMHIWNYFNFLMNSNLDLFMYFWCMD